MFIQNWLNETESQRTLPSKLRSIAIRYSGFFGVRSGTVRPLEISWNIANMETDGHVSFWRKTLQKPPRNSKRNHENHLYNANLHWKGGSMLRCFGGRMSRYVSIHDPSSLKSRLSPGSLMEMPGINCRPKKNPGYPIVSPTKIHEIGLAWLFFLSFFLKHQADFLLGLMHPDAVRILDILFKTCDTSKE